MLHSSGSLLLDLDGGVVESVRRVDDGSRIVRLGTDPRWVGVCPQCGQTSTRSKGWVTTRPRDVQVGPDRPRLEWNKRKWLCTNTSCERKVFTESVPGIPARVRVTPRAKTMMAAAVLDDEPTPVRVLGIDETRRGKAKWETDPVTGVRRWVDRWDTGLVDIAGDQGLLAQVNGRSAAAVLDWLDARDEQWRQQISHVTIDLSSVYAKAVREALPHAELVVDRFHLVKKANEVARAVRRRVTQTHRGWRGRKNDVEWINRRRLLRGAETLTDQQRTELFTKLLAADPSEEIAAAGGPTLDEVLGGGSPRSCCAICWPAPPGAGSATRSGPPCIGSTSSAPPARCPKSPRWPAPSRPGRTPSSGPSRRACRTRAARAVPDRQARRAGRVRIPQSRQPAAPGTVGLHPPLPAEHTQPASLPLPTAKSRQFAQHGNPYSPPCTPEPNVAFASDRPSQEADDRISLEGFPATTAAAGTSVMTTLPAPTTAPAPIVTGPIMQLLGPILALFPMVGAPPRPFEPSVVQWRRVTPTPITVRSCTTSPMPW